MRMITGGFSLEHEDLGSVNYPKQRFADPVRVGIFFFGFPPEGEETFPATRAEEKEDRATGLTTDIYFEGGPPMSREIKSSIARLHCNLGHAPKQEIIRILAAADKLDSKILSGLDALRCGSCIRLSKTVKPPTSSTSTTVKYSGAFGDHLQADIIFVRLLTGEACPVLGMICMSTNYQAAKVLQSRSPDHVLSVMQEIWYRPLGLPISITVDADTAFLSATQAWHNHMGIEYDIIPTEEAWRLGKVGRRNALLRTLCERLIDQNAAFQKKQLDEILVAALFSLNSSTYQYGRSPYQAVFGRVPRPIGDLISDNKGLLISPQLHPEQRSLQPELLRAEALSALAQFSASQTVKRAVLRKTRNQKDLHHLQPGQTVAFWRMQGRSRQHKKGSWNLARFLAFDPDRKSCWVQLGKTSWRIGTTQLRAAAGWENWTPSDEDIKLIKDAENNIARGLWLDETGAPPADEDAMNVDEEIFNFRHSAIAQPPLQDASMNLDEEAEPPDGPVDDYEMAEAPADPFHQMTQASDAEAAMQPYNMATLPQAPQPRQSTSSNIHLQQQQLNIHQQQQHEPAQLRPTTNHR